MIANTVECALPAHIRGEVVEPTQKDVCADGTGIHHADEALGASFDHCQIVDAVERFLFHTPDPAYPIINASKPALRPLC